MARNVERRRKPRRKKDVPNGIEIDIAEQPGRRKTIVAKLADLSDFGCGVKGGAKLDQFGGGRIDQFWGRAAEQK